MLFKVCHAHLKCLCQRVFVRADTRAGLQHEMWSAIVWQCWCLCARMCVCVPNMCFASLLAFSLRRCGQVTGTKKTTTKRHFIFRLCSLARLISAYFSLSVAAHPFHYSWLCHFRRWNHFVLPFRLVLMTGRLTERWPLTACGQLGATLGVWAVRMLYLSSMRWLYIRDTRQNRQKYTKNWPTKKYICMPWAWRRKRDALLKYMGPMRLWAQTAAWAYFCTLREYCAWWTLVGDFQLISRA